MVRDLFAGTEARVQQSYVNMAGGVAPIIAPTLGVAFAVLGGWRAIYAALAVGGTLLFIVVALRLGESITRHPDATLTVRSTLRSYARVLGHPVSLGYALVVALNFGCLFAYVSGSSLVLIGLLGVSRTVYGALFACTALGLMAGALISASLSRRGVSHARLIGGGLVAIVVTALVLVVLARVGWLRAWSLVTFAVIGFIGQGVVRPNAVQGALEPVPAVAGVASAVLSGVQMLTGALASAAVATLYDGRSAIAMTGTMAVCAVASAVLYVGMVRPVERREGAAHAEIRRTQAA
jgi:DHA1 family bicyclomycin/chloramphenicol resistance-like MFS transporter